MAKIDGDNVELTEADAALVKAMLDRGDKQHHIAAYFGVDFRAVSNIATNKKFMSVRAAPATTLPPPGPYRPDPTYVSLYRAMTRVNALWNQRKLKEAKALFEATLRSPVVDEERNSVEETFDDPFHDEFGLLKDFGD